MTQHRIFRPSAPVRRNTDLADEAYTTYCQDLLKREPKGKEESHEYCRAILASQSTPPAPTSTSPGVVVSRAVRPTETTEAPITEETTEAPITEEMSPEGKKGRGRGKAERSTISLPLVLGAVTVLGLLGGGLYYYMQSDGGGE